MRFPSLAQLDRDQSAVYNGAPTEESILVMGPPGTGKTVMAFHRAALLAKMRVSPRVIMFNKVLARYTVGDDGAPVEGVAVSTMHKWAYAWWHKVSGVRVGAPPMLPGNPYAHDWVAIMSTAMARLSSGNVRPSAADWEHLIIDEGQDFPPQMYEALTIVATQLGLLQKRAPAVSVFADENQRMQVGVNSTLEEIRTAMGLAQNAGRVFSLKKNYRNSRPIAAFAKHFYVGLKTGIPEPPSREGALPKISRASAIEPIRAHLARYASNNPAKEIGILCASDKLRKKLYNSLQSRLSETPFHVQTYSYADREDHPADALRFDQGNVLTVLNFQSAKGLEFDAVFIVDPFAAYTMGGGGEQQFKMQMYVMCSRARDYLDVICLTQPSSVELLPPANVYESCNLG